MNRSLRRFLGCAIALLLAVSTGSTLQGHAAASRRAHDLHKFDTHLRAALDAGSGSEQRVIVRTRSGERAAFERRLAARGGRILADHASIDAVTVEVSAGELASLADDDVVVSVSTDAVVHAKGLLGGLLGGLLQVVTNVVDDVVDIILPNGADTSGPAVAPEILRETLGLDSSLSGRGVGVAVIDSGLEMSAEFQNRVTGFYDFTTGGIVATRPYDDYGHGTHVAGTIGGSGALSYSYKYHGLAPQVTFTILKVLDKNGAGYTSDVIRAIDFAVANRAALHIDVINLSLGHPIYEPAATDPLVQSVERAVRAGIVVVAAAGNYGINPATGEPGYAGITSPGNAPDAITVGALRTENTASRDDDWIPDYSSRGPSWYDGELKPDVVAPGHNIVAVAAKHGTFYQTYPQLRDSDPDYIRMSGTSMATAVTSGVVALMVQANRAANHYPENPSLTPNAVKAMLEYSAIGVHDQQGVAYDQMTEGAGAINGNGAIALARAADTGAAPGTPWLTTIPAPWTKIAGEYLRWQQALVWGNVVVWGATIDVNQPAWATVVVWGSSNTSLANVVVWGSDVVWTNPQAWADVVVWGSSEIGVSDGEVVVWGATTGLTPQSTAWGQLTTSESTGMVASSAIVR
ncbi:MAG TPA: S8 family peptidase [Vicinamibacterales bacterium]|nr:S8 family peptidase [Vicinamibacterales bacterium]